MPTEFDWERPIPWSVGGYAPTAVQANKVKTGMARLPLTAVCKYCNESLVKKHGTTPQGNALGFYLRGEGPWCLAHYLEAWGAWKRGLYFGKTALNGW